jgi:hypothetical protein
MAAGVSEGLSFFSNSLESKHFTIISESGCPRQQCQKFTASAIFVKFAVAYLRIVETLLEEGTEEVGILLEQDTVYRLFEGSKFARSEVDLF